MSEAKSDSLHCHVRRWVDWPKDELTTEIRNRMRLYAHGVWTYSHCIGCGKKRRERWSHN